MERADGILSPGRHCGDASIFKKPNWPCFDFDLSGLGAERGRTPYSTDDAGERGISFGGNGFEESSFHTTEAVRKQEGTTQSPDAITATTTATTLSEGRDASQSTADLVDLPQLPSTNERLWLGCGSIIPAATPSWEQTTQSWMAGGSAPEPLGCSSKFSSEVSALGSSAQTPQSSLRAVPIPCGGSGDGCGRFTEVTSPSLESMQSASMKDNQGPADQTQAGVLNLWWGLIQDQMSTLTREIDSLRLANSQMQARQTAALMKCPDSHEEEASGSLMLIAQLSEDQKSFKAALEAEKQERTISCEKLWELLQMDQEKHAAMHEEQRQLISQRRISSDDEVGDRQSVQRRQLEQLCQALSSLRDDIRSDLDRQAGVLNDLSCEVTALRRDSEDEGANRITGDEELADTLRKLMTAVEREKNHTGSCNNTLQSQVESLSREIANEREEWSLRRADLQGKIIQYLSEQEKTLTAERQAREAHQLQIQEQIAFERNTHEQVAQELHAQLAEERNIRTSSDEALNADVQKLSVTHSDLASCPWRDFLEQQKLELRQHLTEMSSKEREQTKTLLAQARQILDTDEALRQKLHNVLNQEMVSQSDFLSETQRIWQALKPRSLSAQPLSARSHHCLGSSPVPERAGSPGRFAFGSSCMLSPASPAVDSSLAAPTGPHIGSLPSGGPLRQSSCGPSRRPSSGNLGACSRFTPAASSVAFGQGPSRALQSTSPPRSLA